MFPQPIPPGALIALLHLRFEIGTGELAGDFHLATKHSVGTTIGEHDNHTAIADNVHPTHKSDSYDCGGSGTRRSSYGADAFVYAIDQNGQHDGVLALHLDVQPFGTPCEDHRPWVYVKALSPCSDGAHVLAGVNYYGNM